MFLNKKLLIIIAIFIVSLLAISAVSAVDDVAGDIVGDVANENIISQENTDDEVLTSNNEDNGEFLYFKDPNVGTVDNASDEVLLESADEDFSLSEKSDAGADVEVVGAATSSFTDLYNLIKNGGQVTLNNDYEYKDGDSLYHGGIHVEKDTVIHGNGKTIDSKGKSIAFIVHNAHLTIEDLNLVNGKEQEEGTGGSIYVFTDSKLTATGCTFRNNHAPFGGAILSKDNAQLSITDCEFVDNVAINYGGAIYAHGGPHDAAKTHSIHDSTFINNVANAGGAIFIINNTNSIRDAYIVNCRFDENHANGDEGLGGAIYLDKTSVEVRDSSFSRNIARESGGAIYSVDCRSLSISGSNFTGNAANGTESFGGAVCVSNCKNFVTSYSNFNDNYAKRSSGAISSYLSNQVIIFSSNFNNNYVELSNACGGAIEIRSSSSITLSLSNFTNNHAKGINSNGGAIYVFDSKLEINKTNFKNNRAYDAGGIFSRSGRLNIVESNFTDNSAINNYGALVSQTTSKLTVTNSRFTGNRATNNGGVILIYNVLTATISGSDFNNNTARYGSAIASQKVSSFRVKDSTFADNTAGISGAIYDINSTLTIDNSNFTKNEAYGSAGAIYADGSKLTVNSIFNNNSADNAGAIYAIRAKVTIGSNFSDNFASSLGGAVLIDSSTLDLFNSNFVQNEATGGGAFYTIRSNSTVANSYFRGNKAGSGGVFYAIYSNSTVANSYFGGNKAVSGGAFYLAEASVNVLLSTFERHDVEEYGGAIFVSGLNNDCILTVNDSKFFNNTAGIWGGAIFANSIKTILNITGSSYFYNNTANSDESGVRANIGRISNSTFIDTKIVGNILISQDCELLNTPSFAFDYIYDVIEGNPLTVSVRESHGLTGTVNVTIGANSYEINFVNGTGIKNITDLPIGEYKAILNFTKSYNFISAYLESNQFKIKFRSYIDLAKLISEAQAGSIITLDDDYEFSSVYDSPIVLGIIIDKDITINGNNHVLDMKNSARMFNITDGAKLTIENLNLKNTQSSGGQHEGSAIHVGSGILSIYNSNFTNNSGEFGAIYISNGSILTVSNSAFIDNSRYSGHGCAIYSQDSSLTVIESTFSGNIANYGWGGAIYSQNSNLSVTDSTFIGNHAIMGGAIYACDCSNLKVVKSKFRNNIAEKSGRDPEGGAIYVNGSDLTIFGCEFYDNSARQGTFYGHGGAISSINSNLTISESIFGNNSASVHSGAIMISNSTSHIDFSDFINNSADNGGALFVAFGKNVTICKSNFVNNSAKNSATIYELGDVNLIIKDSYFVDNNADNGISITANKGDIINSVFVDDVISGSISISDDCLILTTSSFSISNISNAFNDSQIAISVNESHGFNGTVSVTIGDESYEIYLTNGIGSKNIIISVPGTYKAILLFKGNEKFTYAEIESNEFRIKAPSIADLYDLIKNSTSSPVALEHDYKFDMKYDSELINGIVIDKDIEIEGNAHVIDAGGIARIFNVTNGNVKIENVTLINGNASSGGAIIASKESNLTVIGSTFTGNNASSGGAICSEGVLNVYNSTFENNIAENGIGVMANNGEIVKSNFMDDDVSGIISVSSDCIFLTTPSFAIDSINDFTSGSSITISLSEGHGLDGVVTVVIDSLNYTIDVVNGKGSRTVTLNLAAGTYRAVMTYAGDKNYVPVTVSSNNFTVSPAPVDNSKVVIKQSNVQYTGKYSVTVYGKDGKLASGQSVVFNVNGKNVKTVKTNAKGVATFNMPDKYLPNKKYTIKATALGKSASKKVTVNQVLALKTVKVKKSAKNLVLTATLKVDGKYLNSKKVTFKFNGKKYTAKTNSKGVAKVTVKKSVLKKFKVGKKVTYQVTYLKDTVKKSVKIKK